jgi:NAD(P)-dependent dehydrogenase (short-subunit alcohol dehydrogenase family)
MAQNSSAGNREYAGKVAVVTGAAQGIGRAIAEELHERGAQVILVDCKAELVAEVAATLNQRGGAHCRALALELSDAEAIRSFAVQLTEKFAHLDLLVNNAGIELDLSLEQLKAEDFDRVIAVNLRAPFLLSQSLAGNFPASGGAIVNISSIHANHAFANAIPYACSKAGMIALTRNLALELAPRKIRVNAVCPGYIDTAMWDEWIGTLPDPEATAHETAALHPLGRRGVPGDVARAVAYLGSAESEWMTGTTLVVDGGLTIRAHP